MRIDRLVAYILIGLMLAVFGAVGFQMLKVRAEVNDTYPEYSSFRADPKGYRVLFETLGAVGTIHAERFLEPLSQLPAAAGKTLVLAGLQPAAPSKESAKFLDDWMEKGGTLLITYNSLEAEQRHRADPTPQKNKPYHPPLGESENWGFKVLFSDESLLTHLETHLFQKEFSWAGHLYFEPTKGDWEIMAKAQDVPVVMERKYGAGKLILLADAYPLSNLALASHHNAELVSWLFPQHATVIFDESHFNIINHPGIMSLARRYGLDGAIVALLGLAVLYLWASRYRLKPPRRITSDSNPAVSGISGNEVFTNLLRRTVPAKDLEAICLQIWKQKGPTNSVKQARLETLLNSLPPTTSPVARYNQIAQQLSRHSEAPADPSRRSEAKADPSRHSEAKADTQQHS